MLKLTTTFALILLASSIGFAQVNPAKLKINRSIGLDSTYAQILKAFGKPSKDGKATHEECIGGREKTVDYNGLSFYMMDGDSKSGKTFEVKAFFVSSTKWTVSGIKVGDTPAMVKAKLGSKYTVEKRTDNGGLAWQYEMNDPDGPGTTTIVFKKGKVAEIDSAYEVC